MQPASNPAPAMGLEQELARVQEVLLAGLSNALENPDSLPANDHGTGIAADAADEFDWSATLGNVDQLIQARDAARVKLQEAEERAERAEARAVEAEQWLRRLHEAVLKGMPAR